MMPLPGRSTQLAKKPSGRACGEQRDHQGRDWIAPQNDPIRTRNKPATISECDSIEGVPRSKRVRDGMNRPRAVWSGTVRGSDGRLIQGFGTEQAKGASSPGYRTGVFPLGGRCCHPGSCVCRQIGPIPQLEESPNTVAVHRSKEGLPGILARKRRLRPNDPVFRGMDSRA